MSYLMKFLGLLFFTLLAIGSGTSKSNTPISDECKYAKSNYQVCYGTCMASTPGGFLYVAGACGNRCSRESNYMNAVCP